MFDFLNGIFGGGQQPQVPQQQGLLSPQPTPQQPGLLYPGAPSPEQQKWMDALGGFAASLKDAGAYLQHQPEAANNVAAFNDQRRKRLQDVIGPMNYNNMLLGMFARPAPVPVQLFPNGLPPAAAAWFVLQQLQQNANPAARNQMPTLQGSGTSAQPAPALPNPAAATGWLAASVK
jgi:hypothetical protein